MLPRDLHLDKARGKVLAMEKKLESIQAASDAISSTLDMDTILEVEDDYLDDVEEYDAAGTGAAAVDDGDDNDEGLTNAWQYKISVQRERMGAPVLFTRSSSSGGAGSGKIFCHSYDLGGKMVDQHPDSWVYPNENPNMDFIDCACVHCPPFGCVESKSCAVMFFQSCLSRIQQQIAQHPKTVIRLLLLNAPVKKMAMALPFLLTYIRQHSLPVVLFVTVRPWQQQTQSSIGSMSYTQSLVSLRRTCDAVFTCEGFSAMVSPPPPEFSDLAGILFLRKIALQGLSHFSDTTTSRRPPANRYGMKRDRRKMTIRMLHLPPEDFSAGGGSVGTGARSGAGKKTDQYLGTRSVHVHTESDMTTSALVPGLGCASHIRPGTASSLDF
jgi:hypothetical protein